MISETMARKYHALEPAVDKEVIEGSRISGLEQDNILRQFSGSYLLKTNFYRNQISVFNLDLPSPASAAGHPFYNYFLVDSLQVDGRKTYTLRFHPKRLVTSPVLDGEMNIDAEDFAIRSVHASLASKSNVNWIRHINVDIENQRLEDGKWFGKEERLFIERQIQGRLLPREPYHRLFRQFFRTLSRYGGPLHRRQGPGGRSPGKGRRLLGGRTSH